MAFPFELREHVALAPLTTLQVGGASRYGAVCHDLESLQAALEWAHGKGLPVFLLGGGSNVLVADTGFAGLTIRYVEAARHVERRGDQVLLRLGAGQVWDDVVADSVRHGWRGIECLSGIPGALGAAPLQNIGAYGQDVSETLEAVEGLELSSGRTYRWTADACGFGYRTSAFKEAWRGRFVITAVTLRLTDEDVGTVRYGELERQLADLGRPPTLAEVRRRVLAIRQSKSMVLSDDDPNRRSAGSFFVNPVVSTATADAARQVWRQRGDGGAMPAFEAPGGGVKLSAAWLIERAGFPRGYVKGRAGLSSRHTLALINRGQATAADLIALAREIRRTVEETFGVTLVPEPHFLGFSAPVDVLLSD